ncbi:AAA family ATPase [Paraflavitalea speifideaquila]|uniref:AAA family ATPase n=1 Tax=Paraflavitalea speifideaquila TaxID=3076558 RepID=UPI0028ECBBEB|nr:AAA family ATPase [Paraflavitalea speifideiaquila]
MKRILLTGMSGTGKSTVIVKLTALGYKAIDLDCDEFSEWVDVDPGTTPLTPAPGKDWLWRVDRVQQLLLTKDSDVLIVSGCAENIGQFLPLFDEVVLLSAPPPVIIERLATRTNNPFGKQHQEVEQVLALQQTIEPLLRMSASHEIDTSIGIDEVVGCLSAIIQANTNKQ